MLTANRLVYRLNRRTLSPLRDSFRFLVSASDHLVSDEQTFYIDYTPTSDSNKVISVCPKFWQRR